MRMRLERRQEIKINQEFVRQLLLYMDINNISKSELAKQLNISRSRVSQVLNYQNNLTLRSMIKFSSAFDLKIEVVISNNK